MFTVLAQKIVLPALIIGLACAGSAAAQKTAAEPKPVNFGYSQNPKTRTKPTAVPQQHARPRTIRARKSPPNTQHHNPAALDRGEDARDRQARERRVDCADGNL